MADLKPLDLPPPHFHPAIAAAVPWSDFIPSYSEFPEKFKLAIPNIVASVVWHHAALSARLPKSNPLLGSPLFTTHRFMLTRLFPYLLGGTSGRSLLTKSGRNILMEVADNVHTLMRREIQLSVPSQQSLQISDEQMRQLKECITSSQSHPVLTAAQFQSLEGLLTTETATHSQPPCPDAAAPANSALWANVMPLLFLQSDFRFPVGLSLEDAYRRWFCAVPPLPPLHMISAKMIPPCESRQHRKAQKSLRSKFAGCMQVIHGLTPPGICRRTAINMPALAIEDVPVSSTDPSVAWTAATSISETATTAMQRPEKSSRATHDDGQRRSSVVQQRSDAHVAAPLVSQLAGAFSTVIPPCAPSVQSQAIHHDDSSDEITWVIRYKCPFDTCEKHFGTPSGIRHHWASHHDPVPVPLLSADATRTRVDARLMN